MSFITELYVCIDGKGAEAYYEPNEPVRFTSTSN